MSDHPSTLPPQLANFPPEVKEAYQRYLANRDPEAVQVIVMAALTDFMPRKSSARSSPPADDQRLMKDLGYDSLAVAEAVFFLEDLFDVKIGNRELIHLQTVGELRAYVVSQLASDVKPSDDEG